MIVQDEWDIACCTPGAFLFVRCLRRLSGHYMDDPHGVRLIGHCSIYGWMGRPLSPENGSVIDGPISLFFQYLVFSSWNTLRKFLRQRSVASR
jgi:hypothetical protein